MTRQLNLNPMLPEHDAHSQSTSQKNIQDIKKNLLSFDVIRPFRKRWTSAASTELEQDLGGQSVAPMAGAGGPHCALL